MKLNLVMSMAGATLALGCATANQAAAEPASRRLRAPDADETPRKAVVADEGYGEDETDEDAPMRFLLGVERLFGIRYAILEDEQTYIDMTSVTLLTPGRTAGAAPGVRVGLDVAMGALTLGASATIEVAPATSDRLIHLGPRMGYLVSMSESTQLWLRGGLSINHYGSEELSMLNIALSVDPQFLFSPSPHWSISLGLGLDFPLLGSISSNFTGTESDVKFSDFGLHCGLVIWL